MILLLRLLESLETVYSGVNVEGRGAFIGDCMIFRFRGDDFVDVRVSVSR